jgi:hypothetical protein
VHSSPFRNVVAAELDGIQNLHAGIVTYRNDGMPWLFTSVFLGSAGDVL